MPYAIYYVTTSNKKMYVSQSHGNSTSKKAKYLWKTKEKADNVRKTLKKKPDTKIEFTVEFCAETAKEKEKKVKKVKKPDNYKISQNLSDAVDLVENVESYLEADNQALSTEDKCINDLHHFLEFKFEHMNAAEGYKFAKELYTHLKRRRIIKDNIFVLTTFIEECKPNSQFERTKERMNTLSQRKYMPRQLPELFDGEEKWIMKSES